MRKVHLISVTEPLLFDLALAIHQKGYEVSVSGAGLDDKLQAKLKAEGCACYGDGWFPERLTKDIQCVVLGTSVRQENPELARARELGLLLLPIPEFIFQRTEEKTRVVVTGSRGKKTVISMIVYVLQRQKLMFDYALTSRVPLLPNRVHLSYESRIAIIEGGEHATSALKKCSQLEFYRPHIAILTNLMGTSATEHASSEAYHTSFRTFAASIEREGKLIYFDGDPVAKQLAQGVRKDITVMSYDQHVVVEKEGQTCLQTRYGDFPVYVPDRFFLTNLNAARLACRLLGVKEADFYQALSEYSLSLRP